MTAHLFRVGSIVSFNGSDGQAPSRSAFKIEAQMPPLGDVLQYRIKSEAEGFSRVVVEHQLSAAGGPVRPSSPAARPHQGEED